ncbi:unnamed protein product [Rodentolepis nana]|uniref:Ovule protein n=1 Tax=Rodentolepis nana TaxID=102285 RepID=A0A0R3TT64_RODNA|nr:unnamed protein product [Rodentolepis nana]
MIGQRFGISRITSSTGHWPVWFSNSIISSHSSEIPSVDYARVRSKYTFAGFQTADSCSPVKRCSPLLTPKGKLLAGRISLNHLIQKCY